MPGSDALALHSRSPASKESVSHGAFPNARRCVVFANYRGQTRRQPAFFFPTLHSKYHQHNQPFKQEKDSTAPGSHNHTEIHHLSPLQPRIHARSKKPTSNPLQTYQTHRSTRLHLPSPTLIPNHLHQITIPGTMPPPSPSPSLSLSLSHHSLLTSHASLFLPSHSLAAMQSASHPTRRVTAWCTQRVCRPR